MSRHATAKRKIDELAFPVRVRFATPQSGFGNQLDVVYAWLNQEVGAGRYAVHGSSARWHDALNIFFVDADTANRFCAEFPFMKLADTTHLRPS